jgi:hypothetical protein
MENKLPSRDKFAQKVAETIERNHGQSSESFIFGISGKWGEGKTFFLTLLEDHLPGYQFVSINPWKFAAERHSFLRYFLQEISNLGGAKTFVGRLRRLRAQSKLKYLFNDVSSVEIRWHLLFIFFVSVIVSYGILSLLPQTLVETVRNWWVNREGAITLLVSAISIPILLKIISFTKSSRAVSTINQFDLLFKEMLQQKQDQKILIIVDDLDRVMPQVARNVLDNLRTFFDEPQLSFVVAGDHTVLERYIGLQILPKGLPPEQLEEGRRYLKKIFNVYWRLPRPITSEFLPFLNDRLKELKSDSELWDDDNIEILRRYFEIYFDKNFRHIERFIESIKFTFDIAFSQQEAASSDERAHYKELTKYPLLVVRVLLIQEFCAPFFDAILQDKIILADLEKAVAKDDKQKVNEVIEKSTEGDLSLSKSQKQFINQFVYEKPRFYNDKGMVYVRSIDPFLYLAADASMGDLRGPTPEDFVGALSSGNSKQIETGLKGSGKEKLEDLSREAGKLISERVSQDPSRDEGMTALKALSIALQEIDEKHIAHTLFKNEIIKIDFSFINELNSERRMDIFVSIWQWLDIVASSDNEEFANIFSFENHEDFQFVEFVEDEKVGPFTSLVLSKWLVEHYKQNLNNALTLIENTQPHLSDKEFSNEIGVIMDQIVDDFLKEGNDEFRQKRLVLIESFGSKNTQNTLKNGICEKIREGDESWVSFTFSQVNDTKLWMLGDIEQCLVDRIEAVPDGQSLLQALIVIRGRIETKLANLWKIMLGGKREEFKQILNNFTSDEGNIPLAPPSKEAKELFVLVIDNVVVSDDRGNKIQYLDLLRKSHWIWQHLESRPDIRRLTGLRKDDEFKEKLKEIKESWDS